jgi:hypothetical protein
MAAQFYCWDPALRLSPDDADFEDAIIELYEVPRPRPAPKVERFVTTLVSRFSGPDDAHSTTVLEVKIIGSFVDFVVSRSCYSDTRPIMVETARAHGLNCYDVQEGQLYPARLQ